MRHAFCICILVYCGFIRVLYDEDACFHIKRVVNKNARLEAGTGSLTEIVANVLGYRAELCRDEETKLDPVSLFYSHINRKKVRIHPFQVGLTGANN
jgi:hypothetical protein